MDRGGGGDEAAESSYLYCKRILDLVPRVSGKPFNNVKWRNEVIGFVF